MIINWNKRRTRVCLTAKIQYLAQEYSANSATLTQRAYAEKLDLKEAIPLLSANNECKKLVAWAKRTQAVRRISREPRVQEFILVFYREDHFEKLYQSIKVASL